MQCPRCQCDIREGTKFCEACGASVEMKCPACAALIPFGNRFCGQCGHELTTSTAQREPEPSFDEKLRRIQKYLPDGLTDKILSQADKIEGEHRQVTIMFCDMKGFTPLTEQLGPEKTFDLMDEVYEILIHKIHQYEGTVNELRGDGVLALFGAPIALENAPQRAIQSAMAIHEGIARFNGRINTKENIPPILMRIGINTGPVVVGTVGNDLRVQFTVVGDTINMASRMESLAEPGTTYVTENTFRMTNHLFQFAPMGKRQVKGKAEAIGVYKVLSAKEEAYRFGFRIERMIYSEMVGRDSQLDTLELQVMKVVNGKGSIVNIIGEAGVGKSRLLAELKKRQTMEGVTLFEGRAISIGRNLSFHPIIDILKQWARIREDDPEQSAFQKLETAIRTLCSEKADDILPFVATLMGMKLHGRHKERVKNIEGEALERLILKNLRDLLIKATELTPLVIVVEDLHWADASSIDMLESLFLLTETQRILFINLFRPGYVETGDRIAQSVKESPPMDHVEIWIEPLDEVMSEALISNMLKTKNVPTAARDQILKRAGGNPFFLEEVIRTLIDQGVIVIRHGTFEVTDKIETVVIPQTINDLLMARIDRLDEKTRHLVRVASVIGRNFFYRILAEVADIIEDIDERLAYLKEVQLIRERIRLEEIEYLFKHALVQEATYESILQKKRKEIHLQVADAIEKVFAGKLHELYGMLAYHYSKAENLEKTEEYLVKAGQEALRSSASCEALNYYQEGLQLYLKKYAGAADTEKLSNFEKNIAFAFFNKGKYADSIGYFDSVLARMGAGSPSSRILTGLRLFSGLSNIIRHLYLPSRDSRRTPDEKENEILDLSYRRAIALVYLDSDRCFVEFIWALKRLSKFDIRKVDNGVRMWISASGLFSWTGVSFKLAEKILQYSENAITKTDPKDILYYDLFELLYNFFTGNWNNIRLFDQNLVDLNLGIGEFWHVSTYIIFHGFARIDQGAYEDALAMIGRLNEIWKTYGNETAREYEDSLKIKLLVKFRKLDEAQREVDSGIAFHRHTGREMAILLYLGYRAMIQFYQRDMDKVKTTLMEAEEITRNHRHIPPSYISSYLTSHLLLRLHLLESALLAGHKQNVTQYRKECRRIVRCSLKNAYKNACDCSEVLRLAGLYYWLAESRRKASRYWKKSIEEGIRMGARIELGRTYMEIGRRLLARQEGSLEICGLGAEVCLRKAEGLFEEMALQWDLRELEKVTALLQSLSRSQRKV